MLFTHFYYTSQNKNTDYQDNLIGHAAPQIGISYTRLSKYNNKSTMYHVKERMQE